MDSEQLPFVFIFFLCNKIYSVSTIPDKNTEVEIVSILSILSSKKYVQCTDL